MRLLLIFLTFMSSFPSNASETKSRDPSAHIKIEKLSNGLQVVYAPSETAKNVQILVRVDAGQWSEEKSGAAHLLEHYIFKDAKMTRQMTYLEVIKENGGSANAYVNNENTVYYATVPADKTEWLASTFGKMLIDKEFVAEEVEFAKKPVYLEIGRPNPFHYLYAAAAYLAPSAISLFPGFWEREFGFRRPSGPEIPDQITTKFLTAADVEQFYKTYYHAGNMTLFIAGRFDKEKMAAHFQKVFSKLPQGTATGKKVGNLKAKVRDYIQSTSTFGTPEMTIGTKVSDISIEQYVATDVYLNHFSHRLMKELRNSLGETYTARPDLNLRKRNGYAAIQIETSQEAYDKNLKLIRERFETEARGGGISEEFFEEARKLHFARWDLVEKDSETMMEMAKRIENAGREYGEYKRTPFEIFEQMTLEEYKAHLRAVFAPGMSYEKKVEPPLFFRYEELALFLIGLALWPKFARRIFARKFNHRGIRMVRKVKYLPAKIIEFGAFGIGFIPLVAALGVVHQIWVSIPFLESHFVVSEYLSVQVALAMVFLFIQAGCSGVARKLMVVDENLWIKSLGYYSVAVPLADIESVQSVRAIKILMNPVRWWKFKHRNHFYDWAVWRKAILLETGDGRSFLFSVQEPEDVLADLSSFLPKRDAAEPVAAA